MRRSLCLFALLLSFLILAEFVNAQEVKKDSFVLAAELYSFTYKEPQMRDKGVFLGILGSYTYRDGLMLSASVRGAVGEVDYSSPISGEVANIDDSVFEIRGLAGADMTFDGGAVLTPYLGLGFRRLYDNSGGKATTTGAMGYDRESTYNYIPIGAEYSTMLNGNMGIKAAFEYDYFLYGVQRTYLSQVSSYYLDVENRQESGWGLRWSAVLTAKFHDSEVEFGPFLRYWEIDDSDWKVCTVDAAFICKEPENKTT
ncbi:MAG: hypothetical protein A3H42_03375, partial [Deltaproteobacteria bacterium RIFCSPLOWO2_02_FULL_46_8]